MLKPMSRQATTEQTARQLNGIGFPSPHDFGCGILHRELVRDGLRYGDGTSKVPITKPHKRLVRFVRH